MVGKDVCPRIVDGEEIRIQENRSGFSADGRSIHRSSRQIKMFGAEFNETAIGAGL